VFDRGPTHPHPTLPNHDLWPLATFLAPGPAVHDLASVVSARLLRQFLSRSPTLRAMPSCTRRQASAPLSVAVALPAAWPEDPQTRRSRGKRRAKAADAGINLPTAHARASSDTDGEVTGAANARRPGQRRVMARRPRGGTARTELVAAPSGSIAAADSDELADMLVSEVMGAAARKVRYFLRTMLEFCFGYVHQRMTSQST